LLRENQNHLNQDAPVAIKGNAIAKGDAELDELRAISLRKEFLEGIEKRVTTDWYFFENFL
jgi:hypothetical protein